MDFSMFENMRFNTDSVSAQPVRNSSRNNQSEPEVMSRFPSETPLAMAYVPFQHWSEVYSEEEALKSGTLFPELNLPFAPEGGCHGQSQTF